MAGVMTAIQITDRVTAPMLSIVSAIDSTITAFDSLGSSIDGAMDVSAVNSARQSLAAAAEQMTHISSGIEQNTRKQREFTEEVNNTNTSYVSLGKTIMGLSVVQSAISAIKSSMDSAFERMDTLNNFPKVMHNLGISGADAQAVIEDLGDKLTGLPTALNDAASSVQRFTSSNGDIYASERMFLALNNAIIAGGADAATQASALEQLSQSYAKGKPDMMEWRSAMTAMPAQLNQVAMAMGYASADALGESLRNGKESMTDFMNTMIALNEEGINGFASFEEQARDATGGIQTAISNAQTAVTRGVTNITQTISNALEGAGLGTLAQNISRVGTVAENALKRVATAAGTLINIMSPALNLALNVARAVRDNWSTIEPIILGVAGAVLAYNGALAIFNATQAISNGLKAISAFQDQVCFATMFMSTGQTFAATAAQYGFNAALLACPLTWIILLIAAVVVALIAFANHIASVSDRAQTGFGVIVGWLNVVKTAIQNVGLFIANVAIGIWNAIDPLCANIGIAFHNVIANVSGWWYGLLSDILTVIEGVAAALNQLPFVEFDYSGLTKAANDYAQRSAEAYAGVEEYQDVRKAYAEGFNTFEYASIADAFDAGAAWGDDKWNSFTNFSFDDLASEFGSGDAVSSLADNVADTAGSTAATADALSVTNEELKYLRDIAERDAVNRFTTASIIIEQTNNNNINSEADLDGIVSAIASGTREGVQAVTEGVHF